MNDKISTMLSFAIRAGKNVWGVDNIPLRRGVGVVVVCPTLSERSLKKLKEQINVPIVRSKRPLEDLLGHSGKAIGVVDKNMVNEILKNIDENYELISEVK